MLTSIRVKLHLVEQIKLNSKFIIDMFKINPKNIMILSLKILGDML